MFPPVAGASAWRSLLPCLLVLALLLHGHAAVLRHMLGSLHRHAAVPELGEKAQQLHAGRPGAATHAPQQRLLRQHSPDGMHGQRGLHSHADGRRHHHAPSDAGVQALEPAAAAGGALADGQADGAAGSLLQPLALASRPAWGLPGPVARAWPARLAAHWRDHQPGLPERPPRG